MQIGSEIEPTKSWLIVESDCCDKAIHISKDINPKISTFKQQHKSKRYLDAALGTSQFRDQCQY